VDVVSIADRWIQAITALDDSSRNQSIESLGTGLNAQEYLIVARDLDRFRRTATNLYHRVRASFLISAIYRFWLPKLLAESNSGLLPYEAYEQLLDRRFAEAIDLLLDHQERDGVNHAYCSALAKAYYQQGIQTLADQVRRSVRTVRGNQWMFRIAHPDDQPLRLRRELLQKDLQSGDWPILLEKTSVRMDFTHSGWSDIFFLGMDFPEGARVINASINLGVFGRDAEPKPPVEAYLRLIDKPVLRLVSTDLGVDAELHWVDEVFDFAKDYLGLLKAACIASGLVPPGMEGCGRPMSELLAVLTQTSGLGIEIVSKVNDIPKGSRLAVSTNLLSCLIGALMRATSQIKNLEGGLEVQDQRLITARAILGEWLGGSGGGWQDSGGIWQGIKRIEGVVAGTEDPEYGISRGRLLPNHTIMTTDILPESSRQALEESLILIYGGMAQNVGPILEMVTEKYLTRGEKEWQARLEAIEIYKQIIQALTQGNVRELAALTTQNFVGPLQTIIPWCTNRFTESLIEQCRQRWGSDYWGFLMLGGMSGGGMGFFFDPKVRSQAQSWLLDTLVKTKRSMEDRLPFAMDPVVYEFEINDRGSWSQVLQATQAKMPESYYSILAPRLIRGNIKDLSEQSKRDLSRLNQACKEDPDRARRLMERILPQSTSRTDQNQDLALKLKHNGFDIEQHQQIKADILAGRISLATNRLTRNIEITDVRTTDYIDLRDLESKPIRNDHDEADQAIRDGQVGVITLAAGVGSRWTNGAGVVKGLHPFCRFAGKHRSFIEVHLAKSTQTCQRWGAQIPHIFATGYLTHEPIDRFLDSNHRFGYPSKVYLSRGMSVGLRTVPTARDLTFHWLESPQQMLDEQQQKVRQSAQSALQEWAKATGEASDYTDNIPEQCMHPAGHWYEFPSMLKNGTLGQVLQDFPRLKYLLLHNIDSVGTNIDPVCLTQHIRAGTTLSFEVIGRRIEDRGGGLARVDGKLRLLEGMAMPSEQDEFKLTFYNTMSTWIDIDQVLGVFGLDREKLKDPQIVDRAVRTMANKLPTYLTIKDVKKRWGLGQEDVYPVTQFEKLWGDMSSLPDMTCSFLAVDSKRGQQLKDPAQMDGWLRDGSAQFVQSLCHWNDC
jgi:UDP-N-acetylglucosamine pyrophosphorylase/galactokinase/mevalonate kinase-like predicted kinase